MVSYSLIHLSDPDLLRDLRALVARDRATTAALLAHLAEVDARQLYLPAAYPSMFAYCVQELRLSEDAAYKRIRAARTAREFPAIFPMVAEGRLHLGAVVLLAPYLTPETAEGLLAAAEHKSKSEIERLLAERFPRPDVPTRVRALPTVLPVPQLAPGPVESRGPVTSAGPVASPEPLASLEPRSRVAPLAPRRYALQVTIRQGTHDMLRYAQALLAHQVAPKDVDEVLYQALEALIDRLEKRKFAATSRPRGQRSGRKIGGRYIPAVVKRVVWERDGGQCTFVSDEGNRCPARRLLEFDHIEEVARGGEATVDRIRLRCRSHNQYGAECTFGKEFMAKKRQAGRRRAEVLRLGL